MPHVKLRDAGVNLGLPQAALARHRDRIVIIISIPTFHGIAGFVTSIDFVVSSVTFLSRLGMPEIVCG
jgi:hypothetical protein